MTLYMDPFDAVIGTVLVLDGIAHAPTMFPKSAFAPGAEVWGKVKVNENVATFPLVDRVAPTPLEYVLLNVAMQTQEPCVLA